MAAANNEFFEALSMLEHERGITAEYLIEKIKAAIVIAVKKNYEVEDDHVMVEIDPNTGKFNVALIQDVVADEDWYDEHSEIGITEAQHIRKSYQVGDRTSPSVALANNGAEESKGTPMLKEAHQLLKTIPGIRFVGNIEPRDVPNGDVDVVVCDGFTGNVILKLTEGVAKMLLGMLKGMFLKNLGGKLAYLLLKDSVSDLKHQMDSEEYGGAPFLGAKQPVIKAHGSSKAKGIKNAIRQAKICVENDLCGTMQAALDELNTTKE